MKKKIHSLKIFGFYLNGYIDVSCDTFIEDWVNIFKENN